MMEKKNDAGPWYSNTEFQHTTDVFGGGKNWKKEKSYRHKKLYSFYSFINNPHTLLLISISV